jgi:cyclase
MLKVRVVPCLLLKHWGIEKSIRFERNVYVGSPINAARMFNHYKADELILLDIAATAEGRTMRPEVLAQIADEATMPLVVGGGIRDVEDIPPLMDAGADRIAINTGAFENPRVLSDAADRYGRQCVVASIDARRRSDGGYEAFTRNGSRGTGMDPVDAALRAQELGAGEILINSIDRDGTMEGYDLELVRRVSEAVSVPVVALGGASSLADMARAVKEGGASATAAGALFLFWGRRRTVLIHYPTEEELREAMGDELVRARPDWPRRFP